MKRTALVLVVSACVVAGALVTASGCVSNGSSPPTGQSPDAPFQGEDASFAPDAAQPEAAPPEAATAPDSGTPGDAAVSCPLSGQVPLVVGLTDAGAGQTTVLSIAVDTNNVYAVISNETPFSDQVVQVPLDGGSPQVLLSGGFDMVQLATDGAFVYVSDEGNTRLERVPIGGTAAQVYAAPGSTSDYALVGSSIFAVGSYSTGANSEAVEVWTEPTAPTSAAATVLLSGLLDGGSSETLDQRIGVDNGFVAVSLPLGAGGSIVQVATDGGAATPLVSGIVGPQAMAVGGGQVFWVTSDGALHAIAETGGGESVVATDVATVLDPVNALFIASDGASVYYPGVSGTQSVLKKVAAGGGASTVVGCFAPASTMGTPIVVDATFAYWSDAHTIWRAPK